MQDKPRNNNNISALTKYNFVEKCLLSPFFSIIITVFGVVCTIVFGLAQNWQLVLTSVVCTGSIVLSAIILRFYSRQVFYRYDLQYKHHKQQLQRTNQQSLDAIEALHKFIHRSRDGTAIFVNTAQNIWTHFEANKDIGQYLREFSQARDLLLTQMLEEMIRIFVPLLPIGSQPWSAIRTIREEDNARVYKTLLRAGPVDHGREQTSRGFHEEQGIARYLREQHALGKGIVILGQNRPPEVWEVLPNDSRGEDKSVIVGPVFFKLRQPYEMPMILFMNSPKEDVFSENHKPYMKCCTDLFSMLLSVIVPFLMPIGSDA